MTRIMPTIVTRSFQVFSSAQRILGEERLAIIFKKSFSQLYRWSADPDKCEDPSRNPIDLLRIMFNDLEEVGRDDVVAGALRILAAPDYEVNRTAIFSDKDSSLQEQGDCMAAIGRIAATLNDSLVDRVIDDREAEILIAKADDAIQQLREFKDAVQKRRL